MIREGSGEPLVLLHGILCSERVWARTAPLLAPHFDVIAPTALGHRGGKALKKVPVTMSDVTDDAEALLDELGLETAHLAGNSMGGWVALDLARRGRARSVCAISPAGMWEPDGGELSERIDNDLGRAIRDTEAGGWALPWLGVSPRFRRWAARSTVVHGDRISRAELVGFRNDLLGCTVRPDVFEGQDSLAPLDPPPCPITIAWADKDRLFPIDRYGRRARERVPGAHFTILDDVGHLPMLDDPHQVAGAIRAATELQPATPAAA